MADQINPAVVKPKEEGGWCWDVALGWHNTGTTKIGPNECMGKKHCLQSYP